VQSLNGVHLQKTDSVLVVGQSRDLRALKVAHLSHALKALDIPEEVIYLLKKL